MPKQQLRKLTGASMLCFFDFFGKVKHRDPRQFSLFGFFREMLKLKGVFLAWIHGGCEMLKLKRVSGQEPRYFCLRFRDLHGFPSRLEKKSEKWLNPYLPRLNNFLRAHTEVCFGGETLFCCCFFRIFWYFLDQNEEGLRGGALRVLYSLVFFGSKRGGYPRVTFLSSFVHFSFIIKILGVEVHSTYVQFSHSKPDLPVLAGQGWSENSEAIC